MALTIVAIFNVASIFIMAHTPLIQCNNLSFSFPDQDLFHNLSFRIDNPGFHTLFGRSGVGKSTLAKILSRQIRNIQCSTIIVPRRTMYCSSVESLPSWNTVHSHLLSAIADNTPDTIYYLFDAFRLSRSLLQRYPQELSTGQLRRINVMRYVLQTFDLLILDEALNNVDEPTRLEILRFIRGYYNPPRSFLYISHDTADVIAISDVILYLKTVNTNTNIFAIQGLGATHAADCHSRIEAAAHIRRALY